MTSPLHDSEKVVGRVRKDGGWDRRYVIGSLPLRSVEDTRIPPVRIVNLVLSAFLLEFFIVLWALSTFMERSGAS